MPVVHHELCAGKAAHYQASMDEAVQEPMHAAPKVSPQKRFQISAKHATSNHSIDRNDRRIDGSLDAIVVQVMLDEGRDVDVKRCFHTTSADGPRKRAGLRLKDFLINLVEMKHENWSFGRREAQLI
jgi:4-oxalocrotonate tautomerase